MSTKRGAGMPHQVLHTVETSGFLTRKQRRCSQEQDALIVLQESKEDRNEFISFQIMSTTSLQKDISLV